MGTGWRRAFCTTISRDGKGTIKLDEKYNNNKQQPQPPPQSHSQPPSPSPRSVINKLNFFSGSRSGEGVDGSISSDASTPRLQCRTTPNTPKKSSSKSPLGSNPSSPRSPLKLSLFRNSFHFRSNCGVCVQSVKTGQGTAIFTGECGHAFHFHCIADHVKQQGKLICPVCSVEWKDVPLLAVLTAQPENDVVVVSPMFSAEKVQSKHSHRSYNDDELPIQSDTVSPKFTASRIQVQPKFKHQSYNDDEPLRSPRFVPIPEVEQEDEDIEEFKGFFVNPVSSCSVNLVGDRMKRDVDVKLIPESALISVGRGYKNYAIALKVKAPPAQPAKNSKSAPLLDPSRRAPIDLVTVLDLSRSMSGARMQMLKRAMRLVISSLSPADRLSIVVFSAFPKRLLPLRRMTTDGQKAARKIIDRLACGQGTSVNDALRKAAKVLEDRRERNPVASIMLLSDGQDEKVQSKDGQNKRSGSGRVSSTRFGHVEISQEPAEDAFAKCVGGLLSVVLQDTRIQLELAPGSAPGSAPAEITAVYCCNGRPTLLDSGSVRLGDLYAEEERELLVELRVPFASVESKCTLSVKCSYKDPASQEMINGDNQVLFVPDLLAVRSSNLKIEELRNMFVTTRAVAESRRLVEHGEFTSAHHLLSSARALLMQSGLISAEDCVRGLEAELMELGWRRHQAEQQERRKRMNEREIMRCNAFDENGEPLTPTSAWRAAERLAKVASIKKSLNKVSDLHGFENARF